MKRLATFFLSFALIFGACAFTACDDKPSASSDTWKSYFVFDNVTVTITEKESSSNPEDDVTTKETGNMKFAGNAWTSYSIYAVTFSDGTHYPAPVTMYYDGTQGYVNGNPSKEVSSDSHYLASIEMLAYYESSFTEQEEGVFFSESVSIYEDITLTIVEEKIQSISYTIFSNVSEGVTYTTQEIYTFSAWGETTIQAE